jgi:hypothetical protein
MIEIIPATLEHVKPIAELGATTFDEAFGYLFTDKEELSALVGLPQPSRCSVL